MIPYDQMRAMADQRMSEYRADAERHRSIHRDKSSRVVDSFLAAAKVGLERSGLSRIGEVISAREARPAI